MAGEEQRRQVACKVRISSLVDGKYVKEEGWNPNYVLTERGLRVSRVNLMAAVVDIPVNEGESFQSIAVDDSTARISVRDFEKGGILKDINVGDVVLLIGKPREYGGEKYIIPEIIRKIDNKKWIEVRKLELNLDSEGVLAEQDVKQEKTQDVNVVVDDVEVVESSGAEKIEKSVFEKIIDYIAKNDEGEGVDVSDVLKNVDGAGEKNINKLLLEGEIFEVRAGKIKVL